MIQNVSQLHVGEGGNVAVSSQLFKSCDIELLEFQMSGLIVALATIRKALGFEDLGSSNAWQRLHWRQDLFLGQLGK